ncbi:carbonic anhydrase/acetyltransferase-like protein (isoleucine patch superfamily) [Tamaricihabitans halophyticus]|uniref:Carbonic anhydrase/acetyltransferase-like protein (Isoleucine patch superfamily) n=1 Tax=Tamaricihabitans halophyticus TaxID=1262583 RepID=A0A4R2QY36_9PSEU|nr:gamma carbonic anhydrase family protein [Tamaricihabitans halophyticus]TCP52031.1 carbonic anhydrase/acetyltransferase-like protein (isoleucine patch superfamily) [Tamaricihabitans halophyticus]
MAIYALGDLQPQIHPEAYVHPDATVIGDVRLGAHASVWPQAVLRGDRGYIEIGERSNVQDGSVLHCTRETPTILGAGSAIGHSVHVEGARIGSGCLIASGSVVLNGSVIEDGAMVGAGAVVSYRGYVPAGQLALGVPAKCRDNTSFGPEAVQRVVDNYVRNAAHFRAELRRLD